MTNQTHNTLFACRKCGVEKPHTSVHFITAGPKRDHMLKLVCRECHTAKCRDYNAANREKLREYERTTRKQTRYAGSDYYKDKWANCDKEKARQELNRWHLENPEKSRAIDATRIKTVKDRVLTDAEFHEGLKRKWRDWARNKRNNDPEFREKVNASTRRWFAENREWSREYGRKKRILNKDCPQHKIMASVRSRVNSALRGNPKGKATAVLIGAPIEVVKVHIEKQFRDGMTWSNWGRGWYGAKEWHLDHIRPLASFDLTDPKQLAEACHYTNLQPLWAKDNLMKGTRHI